MPSHPTAPSPSAGSATTSPDVRNAKRQKVTRACDSCKSRKRRCTGDLPCRVCLNSGASCTYLASYTRGRFVRPQSVGDNPVSPGAVTPSINYIQRVDDNDTTAGASRAVSPEAAGSALTTGQYSGPTSSYTFLRRAWKRFSHDAGGTIDTSKGVPTEQPVPSTNVSIFAFGDRFAPQVDVRDFHLPERTVGVNLVDQYFDLAMPTYRFFHRQTVLQWLDAYYRQEEAEADGEHLLPARQAAVLLILATSWVFNEMNEDRSLPFASGDAWCESESMFRVAQNKLSEERGRPTLESVQARLASVLYLLQVSRPNQAHYLFGTTVQLAMSIGLHRASAGFVGQQDRITRECRKRTFWAASTLDTYLCAILGRPPLIHLDDVDQNFPDAIDDEDLVEREISLGGQPPRDSVIQASICHAQIARIVKRAFRDQYSVHRRTADQKLASVIQLNAEIKSWHASLPIILSGTIRPTSLVPVFRRQVAVLELAHSHARMLINRPSCLLETTQADVQQLQIDECVSAAKSTMDIVSAASLSKHNVLWYTQFVMFNALSIVYVYLIERKPGNRLYLTPSKYDLEDLLRQAENVQKHLIEATQGNAPSLGYGVVLEELLREVKRVDIGPTGERLHSSDAVDSLSNDSAHPAHTSVESSLATCRLDMMDAFAEFPTDEDLWLTLDSFPYADYGQLR
ncbi:uncharacterized protein RCC_10473 [Ramularia collo-cygni]|uniref:Zn(2)-C6 fungal-type domain-containing protein n=1 Tax=Ramularia collo-cygni TaxID=112498 RepID=A0A2D3VFQ5_9PEZI|nr:uncharacterized protein RCC_10473 [Ramularia collo-cygni]CZT24745.1 uncharacterized protein RCC_10473 [Ramularia collo-cygni]